MVDRFRVLTHVMREESAFSLGVAGRKLRASLEALARCDARAPDPRSPERTRLVLNAADALSSVVIQREALGMRDHSLLSSTYGIAPEVWRAMGVQSEAPSSRT